MNNDLTVTPNSAKAIRPRLPARSRKPRSLDKKLLESSLDDGADRRGSRTTRHDGWTPERIRTFLETLAETGTVATAAEAAGMSVRSCYNLRNRAEGRAFHYAWEGALRIARRLLADALMARAMHGWVDTIKKDGVVVAERHRFDNRLAMAMLTRLDGRLIADRDEDEAIQIVSEELDQFIGIACEGGAGASDFISARRASDRDRFTGRAELVLQRLDNFTRYQAGHPSEIDVEDLDPADWDDWTEEQRDRASRAGLKKLKPKPRSDPGPDDYDRRIWNTAPLEGLEWRRGPAIIGLPPIDYAPGYKRFLQEDGSWHYYRRRAGFPPGFD